MCLQIIFHLQTMFQIAKEAVGLAQPLCFAGVQQMILNQLFQSGQRLRRLQKVECAPRGSPAAIGPRIQSRVCRRGRAFDVAMNLAGFDDFLFDAVFHGGDFRQEPFVQRTRIAEGWTISRNSAPSDSSPATVRALDQHHAFPGLAPLHIISLIIAERACERAAVAFRAQTQVDAIERAFRGRPGQFGNKSLGEAL